jgi:hypothetical protein
MSQPPLNVFISDNMVENKMKKKFMSEIRYSEYISKYIINCRMLCIYQLRLLINITI